MGGFNNVLQVYDRIGGNYVHEVEYRDLVNMMENTELFEKEVWEITLLGQTNISVVQSTR